MPSCPVMCSEAKNGFPLAQSQSVLVALPAMLVAYATEKYSRQYFAFRSKELITDMNISLEFSFASSPL